MTNLSTFGRLLGSTIIAGALFGAASAKAADSEACKTVTFSDVGWTDITATTATASVILDALGYNTETELLSVPVTYTSLANGDVDVFLGNWMPTMAADIKPIWKKARSSAAAHTLKGRNTPLRFPRTPMTQV